MSLEVIKKTQKVLGKYVKRPPLSDKLLGKPPFRFLHDIFNVVISDHGFLVGLFDDDELKSDFIKDKDAKIIFLQKIIDATSMAVNEPLDVRPSKIISGQEADKTNLLLQAIAKGIEKKVDSSDAVQQVLSGATAEKPKKSSDKKSVKSKDSKSKEKTSSKDKKESSKSKVKKPKEEKKPSRSRAASRIEKREDGKENAPPEAPEGAVVNGEVDSGIIPQSLRAKSGRQRTELMNHDPVDGMAVAEPGDLALDHDPLEGMTEDPLIDEGLVLSDEVAMAEAGISEIIENDVTPVLDDTEGPNSLLQLNGETTDPSSLAENEVLITNNNEPIDVDPAILKAMNREVDMLNPNQLEDNSNPSDSGVGSLESPKHTTKSESLPATAQSKPDSPPVSPVPVPPTPSPGASRPLSAYHPDLKEKDVLPPNELEDPNAPPQEPQERPRTGMGIRPRTGRKSARPPSARPAPPKVRERKEIPQEEIPRPPTGKPIAHVILDNNQVDQGIDDDDDNFTVGNVQESLIDDDISSARLLDQSVDPNLEKSKQELLEGDQDAKGILVAQILETKKELEDGRREAFSPETPGHRRVPIEQGFGGAGDANRRKEKELIQKDVEKLTSSIQALTRSVNPLAKMLDYLQEDLDSMQKELENWRDENTSLSQNLKAEQSLTEQQLEPLKAQLDEMESAIFDQQDRISAVKSNILRNDEKINRLLAGVNLNS